jgi:hypothetical protein
MAVAWIRIPVQSPTAVAPQNYASDMKLLTSNQTAVEIDRFCIIKLRSHNNQTRDGETEETRDRDFVNTVTNVIMLRWKTGK